MEIFQSAVEDWELGSGHGFVAGTWCCVCLESYSPEADCAPELFSPPLDYNYHCNREKR